ncbi:MAG: hypothetical protein EOO07_20690, partial [Chitinophagaceae bacterium]
MLQKDEYLDLISRYLNDPTNKVLQEEVATFRGASAENEVYFLEIEKVWKYASEAVKLEKIDLAGSTKKFAENLYQMVPKKSFTRVWISGIAASLFVLAVGYWLYVESNTPNFLVKTTSSHQIDSVKLADGSVVILAENSELKYPEEFKLPVREVILTKGQAFFKVAKDKHHPFKVAMDKSDVTVLGTSFN